MRQDRESHRPTLAEYDRIVARARAARAEAIAGFGRGVVAWLRGTVRRIFHGGSGRQAGHLGTPISR